jgi:hypothetical protein
MRRLTLLRRATLVALAAGSVSFAGCLGTVENRLDMLLSPNASENALTLPYTGLINLALLLVKVASA